MSSRRSIERPPLPASCSADVACDAHGVRCAARAFACVVLAAFLAACSSFPTSDSGAKKESAPAPASGSAESGKSAAAAATAAGTSASGTPIAEIPPRALADFNRAVGMMRAGNSSEAELEFKQISVTYPQLSTPYVNLGILLRKGGHLDQSEDALKSAVQRNGSSAIAWTELGATQRMRGEFKDAQASYEKAIAADPNYAAAYRDLGVLSDLYLGDPESALTAFERYKEITGEDKPVSTWIAELRQRTGKTVPKPAAKPAEEPAPAAGPTQGSEGTSGAAPNAAPSSGTPAGAAPAGTAPAGAAPAGTAPAAAAPAGATPPGTAPASAAPAGAKPAAAAPAGTPNTGE